MAALVTRLYKREVPYYEHMKLSIVNSCVLESLFGNVSDDVDDMIWHIIFMMIMKEKMMEIKLTRRWQFSRRNMIQTAKDYRQQTVRLNNDENADSLSSDSDSDTDSDAYTVSSSTTDDEDEGSILEYFNVFGLKIEAGFAFYMKRILQCASHLARHSNLTTIEHSKGIVCRKCHDIYMKKYNPTDCQGIERWSIRVFFFKFSLNFSHTLRKANMNVHCQSKDQCMFRSDG